MAVVLKFSSGGEFRRSRVETLSWEEVARAASATWPELPWDSFELKYHDDEDDLCLLSPATFSDFSHLNQQATNIRLELVRKAVQAPSAPPSQLSRRDADAGADAAMGDAGQPLGSQPFWGCGGPAPVRLPGSLKDLLGQLHRTGALAGGDALGALFVHFAPQLPQRAQRARGDIDRAAAECPELMRSLLRALRAGLEPFPQLQEMQMLLDQMLQVEPLQGVGVASEAFLQALAQLPFEQQCDVVSVALGGVLERLLPLVPEEVLTATDVLTHKDAMCDGCGAWPIVGPCFMCLACPGYLLCGACYLQKDVLHPGHEWHCEPPPGGKSSGKGSAHRPAEGTAEASARPYALGAHCGQSRGSWGGDGPGGGWGWLKGWAKGWGKGGGKDSGKGWGKDKGWGRSCGGGWGADCGKGWGKDCGKGWGKDPDDGWPKGWGKGWGKDLGKGPGKAWGKGWETPDAVPRESSEGSCSSEGERPRGDAGAEPPTDRRLDALHSAKRVWRKMRKEAQQRWRVAKKAWKREKRQGKTVRARKDAKIRFKVAKRIYKEEKKHGKEFIQRIEALCGSGSSSSAQTTRRRGDGAEMVDDTDGMFDALFESGAMEDMLSSAVDDLPTS